MHINLHCSVYFMCSISFTLIDPVNPYMRTFGVHCGFRRSTHTHIAHPLWPTRVRDFQFENGQWQKLQLKLMKRKELEVLD